MQNQQKFQMTRNKKSSISKLESEQCELLNNLQELEKLCPGLRESVHKTVQNPYIQNIRNAHENVISNTKEIDKIKN